MNKNMIIKIIALLCALLCIVSMINVSSAVTGDDIQNFKGSSGAEGSEAVKKIVGMVLDVVRLVGAAVAVVMLMTVAAKYMIASSGDRADIKKYALNYVIGAIILFAASSILKMIKDTIVE